MDAGVRKHSSSPVIGAHARPERGFPMMKKILLFAVLPLAWPQQVVKNYTKVTQQMLENPPAEDWLMYSRTYDAQRYSPLRQITRQNVNQLRMAWSRGFGPGTTETIPLVHNGVIYVVTPGAIVQAIDGATGDLIWQYQRKVPQNVANGAKTKNLAIYQDVILYTAPDGFVVGIDARTGELRWETKAGEAAHTSGPIVVDGKMITGRACTQTRESCFIAAHDALTGKELWKFFNVPGPGEPGNESWNGAAMDKMRASTWGLPGTYDPARKTVYWGIANAMPNTRMERHNGNPDGTGRTAPADLYSNSTVALDPETGKLKWYYQHLPGDDWDEDYTHERTLVRTAFNPDPKFVKWFNPDVKRGEIRDAAVMVGEGGGIFVLDRNNGQFLWATPFPFDVPNFLISNIDGKTGKVTMNYDLVMKYPGDHHVICFFNTRSYWPTAYSPVTNSLYVDWTDNCLDMTAANPAANPPTPARRGGVLRAGGNPQETNGLAKINLSTGEILRFGMGRAPANGAMLATAGGLIFHGDLNRRFRAYDEATGKQLWETILGGPISVSTITYAINGKQYVAVMTGEGSLAPGLARQEAPELNIPRGHNAMYVFALP
jgi:PQQ-dependent dehydrogenase (methanol/ethanol family)